MDGWWSLAVAAGLSVGTGVWRLYRRQARDILGAVGMGGLGVLLGAVVGSVLPGGLMVGSIGGVALAWKRLDAVRSNRRAELNALLAGAGSSAEKRLTLLDRADALSVDGRARLAEIAAVGGLSTASVCGIVIGAVTHSGVACVLGAALAFLPAAVLAQRYVAHHERRDVSKLLHGIDDPWPGQ